MHGSWTRVPFEIMSLCNSGALGAQYPTLSIVEYQCAFVRIQNPNEKKKKKGEQTINPPSKGTSFAPVQYSMYVHASIWNTPCLWFQFKLRIERCIPQDCKVHVSK